MLYFYTTSYVSLFFSLSTKSIVL